MTTHNNRHDEDLADVPYLPAARPVTTGPASTPVAPSPAEPAFDAKAMVESQQHYRADPAYGALPSGTEASRDAAGHLRSQAQKRRRRNRHIGRAVAIVLLVGVGVAGWFGYQAYQDQQERDAAEPTAAADDEASGAATAALSPLGEQQQIIEGMEALNDTTQASAADPFAARTVDFTYRRWEAAAGTSPMVEYVYAYDRVADTYTGDIRTDGSRTTTGTDVQFRFTIHPDGVVDRVARSAASLDPAPDIALANVFDEGDVLPPEARPFATLVDTNLGTGAGDVFGYTIDTDQWRDRDPGSFLTWVTTWHPRPADDPSLVDVEQREVSADHLDTTPLREASPPEPIFDAAERNVPGAAVTFVVAAEGHVTFAAIVDSTADFRVEYLLTGARDASAQMDLGDRNWVPAP